MTRYKTLVLAVISLAAMIMVGCSGSTPNTPQDKLFETIINIAIYTMLTMIIFDWLLGVIDVKLGKTGKIVLASIVGAAYVAISFFPGGFPLPGLK
jgi:hypothetical protein